VTVDNLCSLLEKNDQSILTYDSVILKIAQMESKWSTLTNNLTFYKSVSTDAALRDKSLAIEEKFDDFDIALWMREDFYNIVKRQNKHSKIAKNGITLIRNRKDMFKKLCLIWKEMVLHYQKRPEKK
jgi:Zn-dependent oligopeptidase